MKKTIVLATFTLAIISFAFTAKDQSTWAMDKAHAKLGFTATHLLVSDVDGWFKTFDAKITSTKEDFSDASVEMTADVNSINTEVEKRDTHLKSPDFFDAAKYPTLTFKSMTFKKADTGKYKVTGNLTMHGVTKAIELDAVSRMGTNAMNKKVIAGFKVTGVIKRSDFGIGTTTPNAIVSDEIALIANVEFGKTDLTNTSNK